MKTEKNTGEILINIKVSCEGYPFFVIYCVNNIDRLRRALNMYINNIKKFLKNVFLFYIAY